MNIEEAIKTSLEYEAKVVGVYGKYVNQLSSETARKVFSVLEQEEKDHVAYLEAKLLEWQKSGTITVDRLKTVVPDEKTLKTNIKSLKKIAKEGNIESDIDAFQKALALEIKTSNYYKGLVSKLPAENRELFEQFVAIEEGHEAIVRAEIDNARGLGFWFDFMEFNLEAG